MTAYKQLAHSSQGPVDSVNILDLAEPLCASSEVRAFLNAIPEPEPEEVTARRWEIIESYESGAIGAVEAFRALEAYGCLYDPDEVMRAYCAGLRCLLGVPEPPTPSSSAIKPPSDELVRTLVTSRAKRTEGEAA